MSLKHLCCMGLDSVHYFVLSFFFNFLIFLFQETLIRIDNIVLPYFLVQITISRLASVILTDLQPYG